MSDDNGCTNEWHHQAHDTGARCPECNNYGPWEARDDNGDAVDAVMAAVSHYGLMEWESFKRQLANPPSQPMLAASDEAKAAYAAVRAAVEQAVADARIDELKRATRDKNADSTERWMCLVDDWKCNREERIAELERQRGVPERIHDRDEVFKVRCVQCGKVFGQRLLVGACKDCYNENTRKAWNEENEKRQRGGAG